VEAAEYAGSYSPSEHVNNGEEAQYRIPFPAGPLRYTANYSKGLPHSLIGEVDPAAYRALLRAFDSQDPNVFEQIPLALEARRRLCNPQAGIAFDLEGPDTHNLTMPPAPRIDSPENSAEIGELYWMALLRDVSFRDYGTGLATDAGANTTADAAASLTNDFSQFNGPRTGGAVTPATLFRGIGPGVLDGPYLSQFLRSGQRILH